MAVGTESRVVACSRLPRITASDDIKKNNSKRPYIARLRGVKSFIGNIASLTFCCSCLNALTTKKNQTMHAWAHMIHAPCFKFPTCVLGGGQPEVRQS